MASMMYHTGGSMLTSVAALTTCAMSALLSFLAAASWSCRHCCCYKTGHITLQTMIAVLLLL